MLGCDSSHTETYSQLINSPQGNFFHMAKLEWLWGTNQQQAIAKGKELGIPNICDSIEDAVKEADLVFVSNRFGDDHFVPAKLALEKKKAVYIDKPFTNNYEQALELSRISQISNSPLFSFSAYRFSNEVQSSINYLNTSELPVGALFACPADCKEIPDPRVKDIHWYGVHITDILVTLFGTDFISVLTQKNDKAWWVTLVHKNGMHFTLNFTINADDFLHYSIYHREKVVHQSIATNGTYYTNTLSFLLKNLKISDLQQSMLKQACKSIEILDGIIESEKTKKEVYLKNI